MYLKGCKMTLQQSGNVMIEYALAAAVLVGVFAVAFVTFDAAVQSRARTSVKAVDGVDGLLPCGGALGVGESCY
jgi:hypothetical protein